MLTICEQERVGNSTHTVATASGVLHRADVCHLERALKAVLLPRHVVLLDVSDLRVPDTRGVTVFSRAILVAGGWPVARMVLIGTDARLRSALCAANTFRDVLVADDLDQARTRVDHRPSRVCRRITLPATPSACRTASAFLDGISRDWGAQPFVRDAKVVAAELVAGVARQSARPSLLTVSLSGSAMRVALRSFGGHCRRPTHGGGALDPALRSLPNVSEDCGITPRSDGVVAWASIDRSSGQAST